MLFLSLFELCVNNMESHRLRSKKHDANVAAPLSAIQNHTQWSLPRVLLQLHLLDDKGDSEAKPVVAQISRAYV
jgi:hypothetical protein